MIKSMTACARSEKTMGAQTVSIEIRTYNHRYLDIALRLPSAYVSFEERVKGLIGQNIYRGRVEIGIKIKDTSEAKILYEIDAMQAKAYVEGLENLKKLFDISTPVTLDQVLAANGVLRPVVVEKNEENLWPLLQEALEESLAELDLMRIKEGSFIEKDFLSRLQLLTTQLTAIENASEGMLGICQQRLKDRILLLTKNSIEIDMTRIAQEAAFMADKSDITEEILRAKSHIAQFHTILMDAEPVGQKLTFLLQELNREFSTIGAKTPMTEVSHVVVNAKSEIEKLREQIQNIE